MRAAVRLTRKTRFCDWRRRSRFSGSISSALQRLSSCFLCFESCLLQDDGNVYESLEFRTAELFVFMS